MSLQEESGKLAKEFEGNEIGVNEIPIDVLQQILGFLNIKIGLYEEALFEIKKRLITICLEKKQHYEEYMALSNFGFLSSKARFFLISVLHKVAKKLQLQRNKDREKPRENEVDLLLPTFLNCQQTQNFHLKVLEMYVNSNMCPPSLERGKISENLYNMSQEPPYQTFPFFNHFSHVPQDYFDLMPGFYPYQGSSGQFFPQQPFDMNNQQGKAAELQPTFIISSQSQLSEMDSELLESEFKECACKGRYSGGEFYLCQQCGRKFHCECLGAGMQAMEQLSQCPICKAESVNSIIFHLMKPAVTSTWISFQKEKLPCIKFKASEIEEIHEQSAKGNLILLKIIQIKPALSSAGQAMQQEQSTHSFNLREVLITSQMLALVGKNPKPKLLLDFVKNQSRNDHSSEVYFCGIYVIKKKSLKELIEEADLQSSCQQESFFRQFCIDKSLKQTSVEFYFEDNIVPFRGKKCQHQKFMNLGVYMKKSHERIKNNPSAVLLCEICSNPIEQIKIDNEVWRYLKTKQDEFRKQKIKLRYFAERSQFQISIVVQSNEMKNPFMNLGFFGSRALKEDVGERDRMYNESSGKEIFDSDY